MLTSNIVLVLFLCLLITTKKGSTMLGNSLVLLNQNDCACSGQILTFECKVMGAGSTVWSGSTFDCPLREIVLRHSKFLSRSGTCSGGAIVAQGLSVVDNCFTSWLNVTLSPSLNGKSVTCALHNSSGTTVVGTILVNITSEPYPPPDNVHLSNIDTRSLVFSWNPVNSTCSCRALVYSIASSNCGICPTNTTGTSVTCARVPVDGTECMFQVQTTVYNNIHGPLSTSVPVVLKVPVVSLVQTVPCYSDKGRNFTVIQVYFNETGPFTFSDRIDGSTISYTTNYTDTVSGTSCGLATIPASSCNNGVCRHVLELSSSSCPNSDSITVTVFGTNVLGNGTLSRPISTSTVNNFVQVIIDLLSSAVICKFTEDQGNNIKSCTIIAYGPGEACDNLSSLTHGLASDTTVSSDSVVINLPVLSQSSVMEYCYVVTASNDSFTAMVKGTFSTACNPTVLGSIALLPNDVRCDPPFHSLGIENGVVCYSGTEIGSVALYSCISCGFDAIMNGTSGRICTKDGYWNGTTPRCGCKARGNSSNLELIIVLSIALVAVVILIPFAVSCLAAAFVLAKDKAKLKRELEVKTTIYEEIEIKRLSLLDTTDNIAYAMHTVSETVPTV